MQPWGLIEFTGSNRQRSERGTTCPRLFIVAAMVSQLFPARARARARQREKEREREWHSRRDRAKADDESRHFLIRH